MFHRFGGGTAKRRNGGVIQVDQFLPNGKLIAIPLPKCLLLNRFLTNVETHNNYNTLKRPMELRMKTAPALMLIATLVAASAYAADKKKDDPNQIGNRDVGKCLNFYSLEKEMALGKQLAEEVTREAKIDQD